MKVLLKSFKLWSIVEDGYEEPETEEGLSQAQKNSLNEKREKDNKALFQIYQAIERPIFDRISKAETSKEAWDILQSIYKGEEKVKKVRLQSLRLEFEKLQMQGNETIADYFSKVTSIVNQMATNGEVLQDQKVVEKILRSLPQKFDFIVVAIEESKDVSKLSLEDLQASLKAHEFRVNQRNPPSND